MGETDGGGVQEDKERTCQAVTEFTEASKRAHERGVRVMAQYPTTTRFSVANPSADVVLVA